MTSTEVQLAWIPQAHSFGARLALVRQHMGWGNVKEAAVACGLPVESWRSWERDGVSPRRIVDIAKVIADRTGVDYVWLLTGEMPADGNPRPDRPDGLRRRIEAVSSQSIRGYPTDELGYFFEGNVAADPRWLVETTATDLPAAA